MKLKNHQFSTRPRIFEGSEYEHPWYTYLNKPNPPTQEAIEKAKFEDKTFRWDGGVRPRNKRSSK